MHLWNKLRVKKVTKTVHRMTIFSMIHQNKKAWIKIKSRMKSQSKICPWVWSLIKLKTKHKSNHRKRYQSLNYHLTMVIYRTLSLLSNLSESSRTSMWSILERIISRIRTWKKWGRQKSWWDACEISSMERREAMTTLKEYSSNRSTIQGRWKVWANRP